MPEKVRENVGKLRMLVRQHRKNLVQSPQRKWPAPIRNKKDLMLPCISMEPTLINDVIAGALRKVLADRKHAVIRLRVWLRDARVILVIGSPANEYLVRREI